MIKAQVKYKKEIRLFSITMGFSLSYKIILINHYFKFHEWIFEAATTDEIGTGGKAPGSAAIRNFSSKVKLDPQIANKVCSIDVTAQCTGSVDRLFNVTLSSLEDAFKIGLKVFSGQ